MQKQNTVWLVLMMMVLLCCAACAHAEDGVLGEQAEYADAVTITILQTSDLHGRIHPFDYVALSPTKGLGIARVASYVAEQRAIDPDLLLVDNGDTYSGNNMWLFNNDVVHPMVIALNRLQYDVWNFGNHEFNYGFSMIIRAIRAFDGQVLLGNAHYADGSRAANTAPYTILDVKGVRVGIFGITDPHVPEWENFNTEHYDNMIFEMPIEQTERMVAELRDRVDVLVGVMHFGLTDPYVKEGVAVIADQFPQVDAYLIGHRHEVINEVRENGAIVLEPGAHGSHVAKVTFTLQKEGDAYRIVDKAGELAVMADYEPDADMLLATQYVDAYAMKQSNPRLGMATADFARDIYWLPGIPIAQIEDTPLVDLLNVMQLHFSGADVSMASLASIDMHLDEGIIDRMAVNSLYMSDGALVSVRVTGEQLRSIMEARAGAYFDQYTEGDVTMGFVAWPVTSYDMFAGVSYEIDISKEVGERIVNLTYKGKPISADKKLTLAMHEDRYSALLAMELISEADNPIVFDSTSDAESQQNVRALLEAYIAEQDGVLAPACDNNWRIVGADFADPDRERIYDMLRAGEIELEAPRETFMTNPSAVNANDLRERGILPDSK